MKTKAICIGSALFISALFAAPAGAVCLVNWCEDVTVDRLYPDSSGHTHIGTSGDETLFDCTTSSGGTVVRLHRDHASVDRIYSLLLSAHITRVLVTIRIENGTKPVRRSLRHLG